MDGDSLTWTRGMREGSSYNYHDIGVPSLQLSQGMLTVGDWHRVKSLEAVFINGDVADVVCHNIG